MKGKHIVLGLLGTLAALLALVFWLGATGGGTASESGRATRAASNRGRPVPPKSTDGGT